MNFDLRSSFLRLSRFIASWLMVLLFVAPLTAQQPAAPVTRQMPPVPDEPTFDMLLAADAYKMYGEVRNVGQLLGAGGAGEIVDPIIKLADPGKEFKSIVDFLKKNSEALMQSRLLLATWPARTDVPMVLVAIEFPSAEDANKFAPKLETFLPTVLPPVPASPEPTPEGGAKPVPAKPSEVASPLPAKPAPAAPTNAASPAPVAERLPFVITHSGNLVCITDKGFKFAKLRPAGSKPLAQDPNFRIARDHFSSESIFLFFNVALEEKTKQQPAKTKDEAEMEAAEQARIKEEERAEAARVVASATPEAEETTRVTQPTLRVTVQAPSPTPTPTKEQQAQRVATTQIGGMLDAIGFGEPQWPEAVGLALALDGNEYVVKAMLIDKPEAKKLPIPFVPQLLSGPSFATDAASVLPDDTEVFVTASIDLVQTYEGMRKAAETKAKAEETSTPRVSPPGSVVNEQTSVPETSLDAFAQFEKKAGISIKDDLLAALGNEVALAGSLKTMQSAGGFGLGVMAPTPPEPDADKTDQSRKQSAIPTLLIQVKDREAMRRLMPSVLNGLGIGEANLMAQVEKREDTEMVNYAGVFAYAFVGNFLVISEAANVRHLIDANINHQTLSSSNVFRNSRRWEPSRNSGQVYLSPALMQGYQD